MNKDEKAILIGMALGDGYINPKNNVLYIKHSINQEDYLIWKYKLLNKIIPNHGLVQNNIYYGQNYDKRTNKIYKFCSCHKGHPYIKTIRKWLYKPTKKYTRAILNRLTPQAIAIWWCDDGHLSGRTSLVTGKISSIRSKWATHCSEKEINILKNYFQEVWDITFRTYKVKNRFILDGNSENTKKLIELIRPYVIPSMEYKINLSAKSARHPEKDEDIV